MGMVMMIACMRLSLVSHGSRNLTYTTVMTVGVVLVWGRAEPSAVAAVLSPPTTRPMPSPPRSPAPSPVW